ncbi:MAG: DUF4040 domain-containing protein [Planctomycetes bacterium]|nr:DUF4040 domain-containing protein [Planctomycetota bacterium]
MGLEWMVLALIGYMVVAALIAVEASDLLSSVIALGAAGFGLSIINLLLGAPDLALTQVVVEIISVVLLVRVVLTRRDTSVQTHRGALRTAVVMLGGGLILAAAFFAFGGLTGGAGPEAVPPFGQPVLVHKAGDPVPPGAAAAYVEGAVKQTGSANAVMAIVLDYRGYDTMGEAAIIFIAIMGVYTILRRVGRSKPHAPPGKEQTP